MKILLVSPEYPTTYWGFQHALSLIGKRATLPPLGLITLAALLPQHWPLRLIDLNVTLLSDEAIRWADTIFLGGMQIQAESMHQLMARAKALGRHVVVGGPAPTTSPAEFVDADLIFQGEAEGRIDTLVEALSGPQSHQRLLAAPAGVHPVLTSSPVPRFDLLDLDQYVSLSLQYSRGCPFSCEFCDVIEIFGRAPRIKSAAQVLAELEAIYRLGFRRSIFLVDDNFIGNKVQVKKLLPLLARWQQEHSYPFELFTEASVNLAQDPRLLRLMTEAGFCAVFLGLETPSSSALAAANKQQNLRLDLEQAVSTITATGLEVMGGFIVGFDQDCTASLAHQLEFISASPIPLAMVGLLTALPETALWRRLSREGRLRARASGDNLSRPNFVPAMNEEELLLSYARLMRQLYSPQAYYQRCALYIERAARLPGRKKAHLHHVSTFLRSLYDIGVKSPWRRSYWRLLYQSLRRAPHTFAWTVGHTVMGQHMIKYTHNDVLPRIEQAINEVIRGDSALIAESISA